ncbi:MAG TPA: lamin tail domain-containing protein [Bacteroidales bacterium]|nr:lamin tail domain-containing protein [Bacteroidales bacterium]
MMGKNGFSLFFFSLLTVSVAQAQVFDDFSDGDFTNHPAWIGNTADFEVNTSKQLHLKGSGTDSACLVTEAYFADSIEWICWIKLSFSPSANNFARFYLCSDHQDLGGPLKGYYLQLGEAGSADALELFRQDGSRHFSVCRGLGGTIAASFSIRVRITRTPPGVWTLFADSTGGSYFKFQAEGVDTTAVIADWTGFFCKFTSSNATKFYFDDVTIRPYQPDHTPPAVTDHYPLNGHTLAVRFSELMDPALLADPVHYQAGNALGQPVSVYTDPLDHSICYLAFASPFPEKVQILLTIDSIGDLAGNMLPSTQLWFMYYKAGYNDVVFNEIMADPVPQVGLPPFEYLELFNRADYPVQLYQWKLGISATEWSLPAFVMEAGSCLILADSNASLLLSAYGKFQGIPGFSVSNEAALLVLEDEEGRVIHTVNYDKQWIDDPLKAEGGWSAEQVDPGNPCAGKENWKPSRASKGGSPGTANTVLSSNPDLNPPRLLRLTLPDAFTIRAWFSESIDSSRLKNVASWTITPPGENPAGIVPLPPAYKATDLQLSTCLREDISYELVFKDTLVDCAGNLSVCQAVIPFGLPMQPEKGDAVINEVLYEPKDQGPEFAEILNCSSEILDLKDFVLCKTDDSGGEINGKYPLSGESRLWYPGEYLALTMDPEMLATQYPLSNALGFFIPASLPALSNEGDRLLLTDRSYNIIDGIRYEPAYHYPLLERTEGVSLERIAAHLDGTLGSSWHSASSGCGYATPALKNSQTPDLSASSVEIEILPPVFSPDNDGRDDILLMTVRPATQGVVLNLDIFNSAGQAVKRITCQEILGTENTFIWDGIDQRGYRADPGVYILLFRFHEAGGKAWQAKKSCVLGKQL